MQIEETGNVGCREVAELRKTISLTALILVLLFSATPLVLDAPAAEIKSQQEGLSIIIRADGSIDPYTAPIQRVENVYVLISDVNNIEVQRNNTILDGNGHTLSGTVTLVSVRNITAQNMSIKDSNIGIMLDASSNVTISGNTITGTSYYSPFGQATAGIYIWGGNSNTVAGNYLANNIYGIAIAGEKAEDNIIVGNNITNSRAAGIQFYTSSNNRIYHNNFNNTINVYDSSGDFDESPSINIWDNGKKGNYWSDYNGTDDNGDGIGDTPYIIDESNIDYYPLIEPFGVISPSPFQTTWVTAVAIALVTVVIVGLMVHFWKRKH